MMLLVLLLVCALAGGNALAFGDLESHPGRDAIQDLHQKGVISGVDPKRFAPNKPLSYAEAVTLYVRAFQFKLGDLPSKQSPKASDYYDHVPDKAWYANAFVTAYHNGIRLPRDVQPLSPMTREEFAYYLHQAVMATGEYVLIEIWNEYADQDEVREEYRTAINQLITMKIVTLNEENQFLPKKKITRAEAAIMLHNAIQFVERHKQGNTEPKPPVPGDSVKVTIDEVSPGVNKVTLSWGEKPNPGYQVTVDRIEFRENTAVIFYTLHYPDPDRIYPQVVTEAKAVTYVDAKYKVEIRAAGKAVPTSQNVTVPALEMPEAAE